MLVLSLEYIRSAGIKIPLLKDLKTGVHDDFWVVVEDFPFGDWIAVCPDKVTADNIVTALKIKEKFVIHEAKAAYDPDLQGGA